MIIASKKCGNKESWIITNEISLISIAISDGLLSW